MNALNWISMILRRMRLKKRPLIGLETAEDNCKTKKFAQTQHMGILIVMVMGVFGTIIIQLLVETMILNNFMQTKCAAAVAAVIGSSIMLTSASASQIAQNSKNTVSQATSTIKG